jgi:hypothetical protein
MVRRVLLSRYTSDPPSEPGRVKIVEGPLYSLEEVKTLASGCQLVLWTRRCIQTVRDLYEGVRDDYDSDLAMVADLLLRLDSSGRYIDSEWCDNGMGSLAACDAYEVCRDDVIPTTGKTSRTRYFVKFAIGKSGQILLVVSCHV